MTVSSNLSLRITAILLGGFVLWQLIVLAITTLPAGDDGLKPYNLPLPREMAALVIAVERAAPGERGALVEALNGSLYSVRLSADPVTADAGEFVGLDRAYRAAMPGHAIAISGRRSRLSRLIGARPRPLRFFAPVTVTVALNGGGALAIVSQPSPELRGYLRNRALLGALGGALVLAVLLLAVRQSVRPLTRLAEHVRRFGDGLDAPDVPPGGTREVAELSAAFNEMKARIRDLMSERTRMLAAIAHDMRTYLTRLRLRTDYIDDASHRARAIRDLDEMTALLNDTLFLAEGQAQPVATGRIDLALEIAGLMAIRHELSQPVTADLPEGAVWVRANPLSVRRIFANLVDNALRHGSAATVRVERDGERIVLTIEDDGPGVPAEALEHLGEPFNRIEPSRNRDTGGAGLGLAIVRALAARDGAEAGFANRPEGGFRAEIRYRGA